MRVFVLLVALCVVAPKAAYAQDEPPAFSNGFLELAQVAPVGQPLTDEFPSPDNGDTLQITTTGLNYWSAGRWPTWTNGWLHVALAPTGSIRWESEDIDPPPSTLAAASASTAIAFGFSPREYLWSRYPQLAARISCVIEGIPGRVPGESGWVANARNPTPWGRWSEHASGLLQFLPSTMVSLGHPAAWVWDPFRSIDAAVEMFEGGRAREFAAVGWGFC